ncbi:MAG: DUF2270 domain-containing protein [Planctomycetes bacterium]|nr:DUF2270 domain-containing protein [Planctomycetota bacterium]
MADAPEAPRDPLHPLRNEHLTMLAHYYRGEIQRSNMWRQRLDATTNWAIITTMGMMSICFSSAKPPHALFLLTNLTLALFLWIEARRYRYFDVWRARTRMMEAHIIAPMFLPEGAWLQGDWRKRLAEDLLLPSFKTTLLGAVALRFRRNYCWLFLLVLLGWIDRALESGRWPALSVLVGAGVFYALLAAFTVAATRWKVEDGPIHKRVAGTGGDWLS